MEFGITPLADLRDTYGAATLVLAAGFAIGLAFGWVAEFSAFCLRSAVIETAAPDAGQRPVKSAQFVSAMFVAVVVTQALALSGGIDLSQSIYHNAPLGLVSLVVGGVAFGVGMVLAGGCVSRLLVLAATGNLRSWFVLLIIGVSAYAANRGILSYPRVWLDGLNPDIADRARWPV